MYNTFNPSAVPCTVASPELTDAVIDPAVPPVVTEVENLPEVPELEQCDDIPVITDHACEAVSTSDNLDVPAQEIPFTDTMDSLASLATIAVMQCPISTRAIQQLHDPALVSWLHAGGDVTTTQGS